VEHDVYRSRETGGTSFWSEHAQGPQYQAIKGHTVRHKGKEALGQKKVQKGTPTQQE
jgi:hypothetical protein